MSSPELSNYENDFTLQQREAQIYTDLKRISMGAAKFYYDACRILATQPMFDSTSHLVWHLMREIDSMIREVLFPLANEYYQEKTESDEIHAHYIEQLLNSLDNIAEDDLSIEVATRIKEQLLKIQSPREKKIKQAILHFLDISVDGKIGELWVKWDKLFDYSLHTLAHRSRLSYRLFDEQMGIRWEHYQTILEALLFKYKEKFNTIFAQIQTLSKVTNPNKKHVSQLSQKTPQDPLLLREFFMNVNSEWFPLLKGVYFKRPPTQDLVTNQYSVWWESRYLVRVASEYPEDVTLIFEELQQIENPYIYIDMVDIALVIPIDFTIRLIALILPALDNPNLVSWQLIFKLGDVITKLAENTYTDRALTIAEQLLSPIPVDKTNQNFFTIQTKYEVFTWDEILVKHVLPIAEMEPLQVINLLASFLNKGIEYGADDNDPTRWWHVEIHDNYEQSLGKLLVSRIIKLAHTQSRQNVQITSEIVSTFEKYKWSIFKKMSMYLLAQFPEHAPQLMTDFLTNLTYMENYRNDFRLLLSKGFEQLSQEDRTLLIQNIRDFCENDAKNEHYWLSAIHQHLPISEKSWFDALKERYGEPIHVVEDFGPRVTSFWVGSPKTVDDLLQMDFNTLMEYLQNWEPDSFYVSKDALANILTETVSKNPALIVENLTQMFIIPHYLLACLRGINQSTSDEKQFDWASLCQSFEKILSVDYTEDMPTDWISMRSEIASIITKGLHQDIISTDLHSEIWRIIQQLLSISTSSSQTEHEAAYNQSSPIQLIYVGLIGQTLQALLEFIAWSWREQLSQDENFTMSLNLLPEVKLQLNQLLKLNNKAVHSTVGRFIPFLWRVDEEWLTTNMDRIFSQNDNLWFYAFHAYVNHNFEITSMKQIFDQLRIYYSQALSATNNPRFELPTSEFYFHHLGQQLLILYVEQAIELEDNLIAQLYVDLSDETCASLIESIAKIYLQKESNAVEEEITERLINLWSWRVEMIQTQANKHPEELLAFGSIFQSDTFNFDWRVVQLHQVLDLTYDDTLNSNFIKNILTAFEANIGNKGASIVDLLDKVIFRLEYWTHSRFKDDIKQILEVFCTSEVPQLRDKTNRLINRIAAAGINFYQDLNC